MTDSNDGKDAIARAIAMVEADTSKVSADVRGSTVILSGEIGDPAARDLIIASLLHMVGIQRVIDSLHMRGENNTTQVYMKKGDYLSKLLEDYYGDGMTWDQYKAAKKRSKPV